jgi:hypothetical protein
MKARGLALLLLTCLCAAPVAGQTGPELREQGLSAYRALEMEAAARFLRLALAAQDLPDNLTLSTEAYLGAAEFYRNRPDSSRAAFRRIVLRDPRFRLDPVTFPPQVTDAFDEVRLATPAVSVEIPRRVTFEPGSGGLTAQVFTSGPHVVRSRIEEADGDAVRTLFDRRVEDNTSITWDGAGARGAQLANGLYVWSFASLGGDGAVLRTLDVPVRLERTTISSRGLPARPTMLPETNPSGPALIRLGAGLGLAALSWIATPAFTDNDVPRIALTATFAAAGIIGFFEKQPGKPIPENVLANRAALEAWEAEVRRLNQADQRLRPGPRILLEAGRPSVRR